MDGDRSGDNNDALIGGLGNDNTNGEFGVNTVSSGEGSNALPRARDTLPGTASETNDTLTIISTWIDSV